MFIVWQGASRDQMEATANQADRSRTLPRAIWEGRVHGAGVASSLYSRPRVLPAEGVSRRGVERQVSHGRRSHCQVASSWRGSSRLLNFMDHWPWKKRCLTTMANRNPAFVAIHRESPGTVVPGLSRLHPTVDRRGVEPRFPGCKPGVVPGWTSSPIKSGEWGSNPRSPASKAGGFPLSYPLIDPGWTRTIVAWMWARSLRRWTTGPFPVAEMGIEPTNFHQALDLAVLPVCVLGRSSCGGRIRTGVERLMRPCWKPDSSPLRNNPNFDQYSRQDSNLRSSPCDRAAVAAGPRE